MQIKTPLILVTIIVLTINLHAATYFVRPGASGNGTSWANAWGDVSNISSSLKAGDIVCVAGGSYSGAITPATSGTSTNPISIRRALGSDSVCGSTSTGWNPSYDAHVIVGGIVLSTNYVTIDGGLQDGLTVTLTTADCTGGNQCSAIHFTGPTTGVTLRYIEAAGPCPSGSSGCTTAGPSDPRGIDMNGTCCYSTQANFLFQYLDVHGACNLVYMAGADSGIIEHSRFADAVNNGQGCHENVIIGGQNGSNITFRYNEVTNWNNEGFLFCPGPGTCPSNNWAVYGNVWHDPSTNAFPRFLALQNSNVGVWQIYNNSFIHFVSQSGGGYACYSSEGGGFSTGSSAYNNLYVGNGFYNCGLPSEAAEDYAASDGSTGETHGQSNLTTAIFVNYSTKTVAGYNLSGHTNPGFALSSPYNIDYNGNPRTTWDRGAFEYSASGPAPAPPTALTGIVK